jgi:antitoxin component YwqK of YwqJK toxin-antitoxin module
MQRMRPQRLITITLLFWSAILVYAQPAWPPVGTAGKDFNVKDAKGKKQGLWYRTYQNGVLYYSGEFVDDKPKPKSTFRYYYESGSLMSVHKFREDHNIVDAEIYFEKGGLQAKGKYFKQLKDSLWLFYDEKQRLVSEEMFLSDMRSGTTKIYYPDGKLMHIGEYKADKLHGAFTEYFPDQKKKTEGVCAEGLYQGKVIQYQTNGLKLTEGKYLNGVKEGEWLHYLENGKLQMQVLYKNGVQTKEVRHNGDFVDHYESGIPKLEITFEDGLEEGPFKEYYDQGEWQREQKPAEGPDSPLEWTEKLVNRQVSREGEYKGGKLHGDIVYYTTDGRIQKTETYENGVLVNTR